MLTYLHIENIAVIEKSDIEFKAGFNVLSGETGAGKSIVIDALNAVLGERTSKNLIRTGAQKAIVNAQFNNLDKNSLSILAEHSYSPDEDGNLIIQRVISADGNGSIKINGQPVTASVLRQISPYLINIHGQHDSQSLLNPETHCSFIDKVAENNKIFDSYVSEYMNYRAISNQIKLLSMDEAEKSRKIDLLKYQINELTASSLQAGETAELERKSAVYRNYDKLIRSVSNALKCLEGEDGGIVEKINSAGGYLETSGDNNLEKLSSELYSAGIELEQIRKEISSFLNEMNFDESEVDANEKRLAYLHDLFRKYGGSEESTLEYLENAVKELDNITLSDENILKLENELEKCSERLVVCGEKLTASRKAAALKFEKEVCDVLSYLDMPNVVFKVDFQKGKYGKSGCDIVEFLISANLGEEPRSLSKIASGGELSRIMLSIKSVLADRDEIKTLIFDEIDTGISGRAAMKVGNQLKTVSKNRQVICVTHLAQIAAKADTHFYIEKNVIGERTVTDIKALDFEGRKQELARIIGGQATEQNLKSAEEMLLN